MGELFILAVLLTLASTSGLTISVSVFAAGIVVGGISLFVADKVIERRNRGSE